MTDEQRPEGRRRPSTGAWPATVPMGTHPLPDTRGASLDPADPMQPTPAVPPIATAGPDPLWWRARNLAAPTPVVLVGLNLVPLIGVLWLGWDVFTILVLYWIESGIIGVVNWYKVRRAQGPMTDVASWRLTLNNSPVQNLSPSAFAPFFVLNYGIFWIVHGGFVLTFALIGTTSGAGPLRSGGALIGLLVSVCALAFIHVVEYRAEYVGRREYLTISPARQMMQPYPRVFILHGTVLLGGIVALNSGHPELLVVPLVAIKTVLDLALYLLGRHRSRERRAAALIAPALVAAVPAGRPRRRGARPPR